MTSYNAFDSPSAAGCDQPTLRGKLVVLRPAHPGEAASLAKRMADDPETSPWWGHKAERIEGWLSEPGSTVFVVEADGESAGVIQYSEEEDPDYRSAGIDVALLGPWIGRGLGSDALRTLSRHLIETLGHHRLTIDPARANERAIRAYRRVGFRPVGVMREYERAPDGAWRDALLMDMLAGELDAPHEGR